jgi:hypothetical protein
LIYITKSADYTALLPRSLELNCRLWKIFRYADMYCMQRSSTLGARTPRERPAAFPAPQFDRLLGAGRRRAREPRRVGERCRAATAREQRVGTVARAVRPANGHRLVAARIADRAPERHPVFIYSTSRGSKAAVRAASPKADGRAGPARSPDSAERPLDLVECRAWTPRRERQVTTARCSDTAGPADIPPDLRPRER